jgi:hypothetical protein
LTTLQGHVAALRDKEQVIQPSEWSDPRVRILLLGEDRQRDDSYILREFKALKQAVAVTPSNQSVVTNASSSRLSFGGAPTSALSGIISEAGVWGMGGRSFLDSSTTASPPPASGASSFGSLDGARSGNNDSPFKPASVDEHSE